MKPIIPLDNSYLSLPQAFYEKVKPTPVKSPKLIQLNHKLATALGLEAAKLDSDLGAQIFSGNQVLEGTDPIAQAYAGHQFGSFTMLGDGRAILLGEIIDTQGKRQDIQLKGAGPTPYARRGDGRAALGPMMREHLISEAMHALGIPTTQSLALVATSEPVFRETALPGAILTRVASSHIRVGTFEYAAALQDKNLLKALADYSIQRHYPDLVQTDSVYVEFLKAVIEKQAKLIASWMQVGFIHGVMNTDNMTISGETIDYGPCAFMDTYDPNTVFSSIDHHGRYAYANQPHIAHWNLGRLAETLLPLFNTQLEKAIELAQNCIDIFPDKFNQHWQQGMRKKLGFFNAESEDLSLIENLLQLMQQNQADFTTTFRDLTQTKLPDHTLFQNSEFLDWHQKWQVRLARQAQSKSEAFQLMNANNPAFIPRNHRVEAAIQTGMEHHDFSVMEKLLQVLENPFEDKPEFREFREPPAPSEQVYQTFCGT